MVKYVIEQDSSDTETMSDEEEDTTHFNPLSEKFAYYHYINVTAREAILYLMYFINFLRRSGETKRALVLRRNVVSPLIVIFLAPHIRR